MAQTSSVREAQAGLPPWLAQSQAMPMVSALRTTVDMHASVRTLVEGLRGVTRRDWMGIHAADQDFSSDDAKEARSPYVLLLIN